MSGAAEMEKPVFKLAFRVPCSEYAGLGAKEDWFGKERLTTVVKGLSFDWCLALAPNGLLCSSGFWAGLKLDKPSFDLPHFRARLRLQVRYEGESSWREPQMCQWGIEADISERPPRVHSVHARCGPGEAGSDLAGGNTPGGGRNEAATGAAPSASQPLRGSGLPRHHAHVFSERLSFFQSGLESSGHEFEMCLPGGAGSVEVRCADGEKLWPNLGILELLSGFFSSFRTFEGARGRYDVRSAHT